MVGSPDNASMSTPLREYMRLSSAYDDLSGGGGRMSSPGEQREQIVDAYRKRPVDTIGVLEEIGRIPRPAAAGGSLPASLEVSNLVRPRLQDQRNALQERSAIEDLDALEQELAQEKAQRGKRPRVSLAEETRRVQAMEEERSRPTVSLQEESHRVRAVEEEAKPRATRKPRAAARIITGDNLTPDKPLPAKAAAREGGLAPYAVLDDYDAEDAGRREARLARIAAQEQEEARARRRPLGIYDAEERQRFKKPPANLS